MGRKSQLFILKGTDWYAVSEEDVLNPGRTRMHPNYDGLNIYGDEVSTNIRGSRRGACCCWD